MEIRIYETAQEASKAGAKLIADVIKSREKHGAGSGNRLYSGWECTTNGRA